MQIDSRVYCRECRREFSASKYLTQHQRSSGHRGAADHPLRDDEWEPEKRQAIEIEDPAGGNDWEAPDDGRHSPRMDPAPQGGAACLELISQICLPCIAWRA